MLLDTFKSVVPFFHRIPSVKEQDEFMDEFAELVLGVNRMFFHQREEDSQSVGNKIILPYVLMTAVAKKN